MPPELSDDFVLTKFKHIYEQYFTKDRVEIRKDGEGKRFIHAQYEHPRFKHSWVPGSFCGVRVECVPACAAVR